MSPSDQTSMTASRTDPGPTDASLVEAYRAGDERAAAELVRRHARPLGRFLYAGGAPREDVEDLVQETFFRAFRGLDGWRGDAGFRSWLFRIGGNLRADLFRSRRGRVVVPIHERDATDPSDPESLAVAEESAERLRHAIGRLPRLQRTVFLLRVQEGLGYDDIATTCGTTPGAARVHFHHAVKRLREVVA